MRWARNTAVLKPWITAEAITTKRAAEIAGRPIRTIRDWCERIPLGKKHGPLWRVSIVALTLFLEEDHDALAAYLDGDRSSAVIVDCYARCDVPLPRPSRIQPPSFSLVKGGRAA